MSGGIKHVPWSVVMMFAVVARVALAQPPPHPRCVVHVAASEAIPGELTHLFVEHPGSALMICRIASQRTVFSLLSAVKQVRAGVCQFSPQRIATQVGGVLQMEHGASDPMIQQPVFMRVGTGGCPDQRDVGYVPTYEVAPEDFAMVSGLWLAVSKSDSELEKMRVRLSHENHFELDQNATQQFLNSARQDALEVLAVNKVSESENDAVGADFSIFLGERAAPGVRYVIYVCTGMRNRGIVAVTGAVR